MIFIDVVYDWDDVNDFNFSYNNEWITYDEYLKVRKNVEDKDITMCVTDMYIGVEILQYLLDVFKGVDVRSKQGK